MDPPDLRRTDDDLMAIFRVYVTKETECLIEADSEDEAEEIAGEVSGDLDWDRSSDASLINDEDKIPAWEFVMCDSWWHWPDLLALRELIDAADPPFVVDPNQGVFDV